MLVFSICSHEHPIVNDVTILFCISVAICHLLCVDLSINVLFSLLYSQRLSIAKEFGDKAAERRAFTNLGNAHIFLGDFELAADYYKLVLYFVYVHFLVVK